MFWGLSTNVKQYLLYKRGIWKHFKKIDKTNSCPPLFQKRKVLTLISLYHVQNAGFIHTNIQQI